MAASEKRPGIKTIWLRALANRTPFEWFWGDDGEDWDDTRIITQTAKETCAKRLAVLVERNSSRGDRTRVWVCAVHDPFTGHVERTEHDGESEARERMAWIIENDDPRIPPQWIERYRIEAGPLSEDDAAVLVKNRLAAIDRLAEKKSKCHMEVRHHAWYDLMAVLREAGLDQAAPISPNGYLQPTISEKEAVALSKTPCSEERWPSPPPRR